MDFSNFWWQAAAGDDGGGGDAGDPIGQSLRFREVAAPYLRLDGLTSPATYTISYWFKLGLLNKEEQFIWWWNPADMGQGYSPRGLGNLMLNNSVTGGYSTTFYRDASAWQHVVINTGANNWWVNGERIPGNNSGGMGTVQTGQTTFFIGGQGYPQYSFDGYISNFQLVDGQELGPETFGRINSKGVWVPVNPGKDGDTTWYGPNGFHLDFADSSNIGNDISGNGNHFTAHGFELTDQTSPLYDIMQDSPTNNFATLNPLLLQGKNTKDANLTLASINPNYTTPQTIGFPQTGKYIAEFTTTTNAAALSLLLASPTSEDTINFGSTYLYWKYGTNSSSPVLEGTYAGAVTATGPGAAWADNTTYAIAWDGDARKLYIYNEGTLATTYSGFPAGMDPRFFGCSNNYSETYWNYGQRGFKHTLAGFEPLSTAKMPAANLPDSITGTFTGNNNADGPFVYTGCIPARIQYGTIDVKYQDRLGQTDVDFLSNGFKVRSTTSNSGTVNYTVTTTHDGGEYDGNKVPFNSPAPAVSN